MRLIVLLCAVSLATVLGSRTASAQYKNQVFGFDAGGTYGVSIGSIIDSGGNPISPEDRPMRLQLGERFGILFGLKMHSDHWWWINRVNFQFFQFHNPSVSPSGQVNLNDAADALASSSLGTLLGLQGQTGVRYTFLTDRLRPYLQGSLAFMYLFTLKNSANNACAGSSGYTCASGSSYAQEFLPHQAIVSFNIEPGIEFVIRRDLALHVMLDYQRWLFINSPQGNYLTLGLGLTFFG